MMPMVPLEYEGVPIVWRKGSGVEWLYRFYGPEGLLYVGITHIGTDRFKEHRRTQPWWALVERIEVQCYPSRKKVRLAECAAIRDERPEFNRTDFGPWAEQSAEYNAQRKRVEGELRRAEHEIAELSQENRELRRLVFGEGAPDWTKLAVEATENVLPFLPKHLRTKDVA